MNIAIRYFVCYVLSCFSLIYYLNPEKGFLPKEWSVILSLKEHFIVQIFIVYALFFIGISILHKKLNKLNFVFFTGMFFSAVTFVYLIYFTHGEILKGVIYSDPLDTFMDYYNCISIGNNPYKSAFISIYPPLTMFFFTILGHMSSPEMIASWHDLAVKIRGSQIGMTVFGIYLSLVYSVIVCFWYELKKGNAYEKVCFVFVMLMSTPFIFLLERGNIIILTMFFLGCYLYLYKHQNRYWQIVSFVCLSIAVAMKLSPAIFSLLILRERRFKDFLLLSVIEFIVVFFPFFFFDEGLFVQIKLMVANITNLSKIFAGTLFPTFYLDIKKFLALLIPGNTISFVKWGIVLIGIVEVLYIKKMSQWRVVAILTILSIVIPAFSAIYSLIYMTIPLMLFLDKPVFEEEKIADFIYVFLFVGIFCLIPNISRSFMISTLIESACLVGMVVLLEIQGIYEVIK